MRFLSLASVTALVFLVAASGGGAASGRCYPRGSRGIVRNALVRVYHGPRSRHGSQRRPRACYEAAIAEPWITRTLQTPEAFWNSIALTGTLAGFAQRFWGDADSTYEATSGPPGRGGSY